MAQSTSNIILGSGRLYINNVEVGYLKGDVEFVYTREKLDFKPSGALGPVAQFTISENAELRAPIAEFKAANLRLAMGINEAVGSFTGSPSYNPASFSGASGTTFDKVSFGGSTAIDDSLAIRFEHIRPNSTKKIVVIMYTAVSLSDITLPFHDEDFNIINVSFKGLADSSRPVGDRIGMVIEEL